MERKAGLLPNESNFPSRENRLNQSEIQHRITQSQLDPIKDQKTTLEQFPLIVKCNIVDQANPSESDLSIFADYICSLNITHINFALRPVMLEESQPYIEAYQQSTSGKKEKEAIIQNCHILGLSNNQTLETLNQGLKNYYKAINRSGINYFDQETSSNLSSDSNDNKNTSKNLENKIKYLIRAFYLRYRQTTEMILSCETQLKQEISNPRVHQLAIIQLLKKIYIFPPTFYSELINKRTDFTTIEMVDFAIKFYEFPEIRINEINKKSIDLKRQYPHATNYAIFKYITRSYKIKQLIISENFQKKRNEQPKIHLDKPKKNIDSKTNNSRKHSHIPLVTPVDPILKQKYQESHHPLLTDIVIDIFLRKFSQPDIEIEKAKSTYESLVETFKEKIKKNNTILLAITEACLSDEDDSVSLVNKYIARFDSFIKYEKYSNILPSIIASTTIRLITKEITLERAISILNNESKQWQ